MDSHSTPGSGQSPGEVIGYPPQYSRALLVAQLVKICLQCGRPGSYSWAGKILWRRAWPPTPVFWSGEFYGLYSPWGCKESHTWLSHFHFSVRTLAHLNHAIKKRDAWFLSLKVFKSNVIIKKKALAKICMIMKRFYKRDLTWTNILYR